MILRFVYIQKNRRIHESILLKYDLQKSIVQQLPLVSNKPFFLHFSVQNEFCSNCPSVPDVVDQEIKKRR